MTCDVWIRRPRLFLCRIAAGVYQQRSACSGVSQFPSRTPICLIGFTRRMPAAKSGLSRPQPAASLSVDRTEAVQNRRLWLTQVRQPRACFRNAPFRIRLLLSHPPRPSSTSERRRSVNGRAAQTSCPTWRRHVKWRTEGKSAPDQSLPKPALKHARTEPQSDSESRPIRRTSRCNRVTGKSLKKDG